jgi:hypothetical protein
MITQPWGSRLLGLFCFTRGGVLALQQQLIWLHTFEKSAVLRRFVCVEPLVVDNRQVFMCIVRCIF